MTNKLKEFQETTKLKTRDIASLLGQAPQTVRAKMCGLRNITQNDLDTIKGYKK